MAYYELRVLLFILTNNINKILNDGILNRELSYNVC